MSSGLVAYGGHVSAVRNQFGNFVGTLQIHGFQYHYFVRLENCSQGGKYLPVDNI